MSTLERLPERLDALSTQISDLRAEVRGGFSAVRAEMARGLQSLRDEMFERCAMKEDLERFATKADLEGFATKADLQAGLAELRAQMLALHEDSVAKIAPIQEGLPRRRRRH